MRLIFRRYFILSINNLNRIKHHISEVSEGNIGFVGGDGLFLATFLSSFELSELETHFKDLNYNFVIFDITKDNFGGFLGNDDLNNTIFGNGENLMNAVNAKFEYTDVSAILDEPKIENLSKNEKMIMIDKLLDKGIDKLTDEEIKLLKNLSN